MSKTRFGILITVSLKSKRLKNKAILDLGNQTDLLNRSGQKNNSRTN